MTTTKITVTIEELTERGLDMDQDGNFAARPTSWNVTIDAPHGLGEVLCVRDRADIARQVGDRVGAIAAQLVNL